MSQHPLRGVRADAAMLDDPTKSTGSFIGLTIFQINQAVNVQYSESRATAVFITQSWFQICNRSLGMPVHIEDRFHQRQKNPLDTCIRGIPFCEFVRNALPTLQISLVNGLGILSILVELWGRFSLGRNIGFVPAQRDIVIHGAYRYMRHPIYTGLFIGALGETLAYFSPRNLLLTSLGVFWFVIKSFVEESFLSKDAAYAAYMQCVRYRWIPGVV